MLCYFQLLVWSVSFLCIIVCSVLFLWFIVCSVFFVVYRVFCFFVCFILSSVLLLCFFVFCVLFLCFILSFVLFLCFIVCSVFKFQTVRENISPRPPCHASYFLPPSNPFVNVAHLKIKLFYQREYLSLKSIIIAPIKPFFSIEANFFFARKPFKQFPLG